MNLSTTHDFHQGKIKRLHDTNLRDQSVLKGYVCLSKYSFRKSNLLIKPFIKVEKDRTDLIEVKC
jgi:hypothetical protein